MKRKRNNAHCLSPELDAVVQLFEINPIPNREAVVRQFDQLYRKKSWEAWRRLPRSIQIFLEPDDLYQEAVLEAVRCYEKWDPTIATFSTFVYTAVSNRLSSIVGFWKTQKRVPTIQISLMSYIENEEQETNVVDRECFRFRRGGFDLTVDPIMKLIAEGI